jgi:hypothetical protein
VRIKPKQVLRMQISVKISLSFVEGEQYLVFLFAIILTISFTASANEYIEKSYEDLQV